MNNNKGFTLIELIVIILVMGILVGIGYPNYMKSLDRKEREADEMAIFQLNDCTETYAMIMGASLDFDDGNFVFIDCLVYDADADETLLNADLMMNKLMENGYLIAPPSVKTTGAKFGWDADNQEWEFVPES